MDFWKVQDRAVRPTVKQGSNSRWENDQRGMTSFEGGPDLGRFLRRWTQEDDPVRFQDQKEEHPFLLNSCYFF
jgi:hypothetical protein